MQTMFTKPLNTDDRENVNVDDKFKENLVKKAARMVKDQKSLKLCWIELRTETGINCTQVWKNMQRVTLNKLSCLLAANDLLKDVSSTMWLSPIDWMLLNLVLVHNKINVIDCEKLPQCIKELYKLVQENKVEDLVGDELAHAWISITLQYNKRGRQCSPMLLQLRWYQLKKLSRKQVYKPNPAQDVDNIKMLHAIAIKYQKIITKPFPKWKTLIEEKRVILPEQFIVILNRERKWNQVKARDKLYLQSNEFCNSDDKSESSTDVGIIDAGNEIDKEKILDESISLIDVNRKKRHKVKSNAACSMCFNNDSRKKRGDNIDPKLSMKPIVFTKKIDSMKVFKDIEYKFVKDKEVIEFAILENRPIAKRVSKDKFGKVIREDQGDGDIKTNVSEISYNTIKSTSWLLQKPKQCKYNSVQLSRNPDFDINLKIRPPAYLRSTRNRILLQKCKPLTIDLNKEFEKKLINGKIYVEDLKFRNGNIMAAEARCNEDDSNNISKKVNEPIHNTTTDILSSPSIETNQMSNQGTIKTLDDPRKIINLPNIDQVRKNNENLQTAEVKPIRNFARYIHLRRRFNGEPVRKTIEKPTDLIVSDEN